MPWKPLIWPRYPGINYNNRNTHKSPKMAKLTSSFLKWPWKQQTDKNNLKTSKMIEETLKSPKIPKYQPMTKILLNLQNNQNIF